MSQNNVETSGVKTFFDSLIEAFVQNIGLAVFCSLLASALYSNITNKKSISEREKFQEELEKNIKQEIENITRQIYKEQINDGTERIAKKVSEIYNDKADMMPSHYYHSTDIPSNDFNMYMNDKIKKSKKFVYFGESARFSCKRLYRLKDQAPNIKNLKVDMFLVDPRCDDAFEYSKSFLEIKEKNKNSGSKKLWEKIVEEEKLKILYCLYALENMKESFLELTVYLLDHIPFMDIELTDDTVVLEFFRTRSDYKRYPLTMIYEDKKAYYESYEFYLEWEKERAIAVNKDTLTEQMIVNLGIEAGITDLKAELLEKYCQEEIFKDTEQYL